MDCQKLIESKVCAWKTCNSPIGIGRRFCGVRCKRKFFVDKRRKELKQRAIAYKGGACERCGYNYCVTALTFHHLDPANKDFGVSAKGLTRGWARLLIELDKCVLLCANCHAEIHEGQPLCVSKDGKPGEFGERCPNNAEPSPLRGKV